MSDPNHAHNNSGWLYARICRTSDLCGVVDIILSGDILRDWETGAIHSTANGATQEALCDCFLGDSVAR